MPVRHARAAISTLLRTVSLRWTFRQRPAARAGPLPACLRRGRAARPRLVRPGGANDDHRPRLALPFCRPSQQRRPDRRIKASVQRSPSNRPAAVPTLHRSSTHPRDSASLSVRDIRLCRVALVPKELAVRASVHGHQGGARRAGSGSWTRSVRLPVGSAIHPSVRAAPSWSAVGVVVSPRAAARALSAAMTASRAWSDRRQAGSWSRRRSQDAAAVRVSTSWWRTVVFAAGAVGLIVR